MTSITETAAKVQVIVWTVAFIGICTLVALNKIPPSTIEYLLFWAAGSVGGQIKLPSTASPLEQGKEP